MSDIVYEAPPRSGDNIEGLADTVRRGFGLLDVHYFPVVPFVEMGLQHLVDGLEFDVVEVAEMGARMGAVNPLTGAFMIREDVYEAAVNGQPRHRFTVAHEAGHALMHVRTLNRLPTSMGKVPAFRDPEWQANRFAAALLMPRHLIKKCSSIREIMEQFGVSKECAEMRTRNLKLEIYN
jgi:hypothetical protein